MLFSSKLENDYLKEIKERWVFCIDIDDKMKKYIADMYEWIKTQPSVRVAEFELDNYRSRCIDMESYNEVIEIPFTTGDDPLDYYGSIYDYGRTPNEEYWKLDGYFIPENFLCLSQNGLWFKIHSKWICGKSNNSPYYIETYGENMTDFLKV